MRLRYLVKYGWGAKPGVLDHTLKRVIVTSCIKSALEYAESIAPNGARVVAVRELEDVKQGEVRQ